MIPFQILSDPNCKSNGSTRFIVDAINSAAKDLGIYSEKSDSCRVCYDTLCQQYNYNPHILFCAYELPSPKFILQNAGGKPIIGLSRINGFLAAFGGYPPNLCNYVTLGVDSKKWSPVGKSKMTDKFVFLGISESTVRSGFETLIPVFGRTFQGNKNVVLYLRDRGATDLFKIWVKEQAITWDVEIIHDDRDIHDYTELLEIYKCIDCGICINHSHTYALQAVEVMSCGIPNIICNYCGPADYSYHEVNALCPTYSLEEVTQTKLHYLTSIGLKNYLLPISSGNYLNKPFWATVHENELSNCMLSMIEDKDLRERLAFMSRLTAEQQTWHRTAFNMSAVIYDLFKK